jgi:hypothetical protein
MALRRSNDLDQFLYHDDLAILHAPPPHPSMANDAQQVLVLSLFWSVSQRATGSLVNNQVVTMFGRALQHDHIR